MKLRDSQRKIISEICKDFTKLVGLILIIGQFVPGQQIDITVIGWAMMAAAFFLVLAVILAPIKEG
jgi:hypothetical protein